MTTLIADTGSSLLAAPLLFRSAPVANEAKAEKTSVVHCKTPSEFMHLLLSNSETPYCNAPEPDDKGSLTDSSSHSSDKSSVSNHNKNKNISHHGIKDDVQPPLRLTQEWTIAASHGEAWHAVTSDRVDHVLHTWSLLTANLVTPGSDKFGGINVCFFPTRLPNGMASGESVYREVRSRIPIRLVHGPIPGVDPSTGREEGSEEDPNGSTRDTLVEFLRTHRMYARRLRTLLHDGVLGILSRAPDVWDDERDGLSTSTSFGGACSSERPTDGVRYRAMHRLLPLMFAETMPVVCGVHIWQSGPNYADVTLELRIVARLHADAAAVQSPESITLDVLSQAFPERFAIYGAKHVEIGDLDASGCVQAWHRLSPSAIIEAQRQHQQLRRCLCGTDTLMQPLSLRHVVADAPLISPRPRGSRMQHDPYAQTPTNSEGVSKCNPPTESGEVSPRAAGCASSVSSAALAAHVRIDGAADKPAHIHNTVEPLDKDDKEGKEKEEEEEEKSEEEEEEEEVNKDLLPEGSAERVQWSVSGRTPCGASAETEAEAKSEVMSEEAPKAETEEEVVHIRIDVDELMALAKELTASRWRLAELRANVESANHPCGKKKESDRNGTARRQKGRNPKHATDTLCRLLATGEHRENGHVNTSRTDELQTNGKTHDGDEEEREEEKGEEEEHECIAAAAAAFQQLDECVRAEAALHYKHGGPSGVNGEHAQNSNHHQSRHRRKRRNELPFIQTIAKCLRPHPPAPPSGPSALSQQLHVSSSPSSRVQGPNGPRPSSGESDGPVLVRCAAARHDDLERCVEAAFAAIRAAAAVTQRIVAALAFSQQVSREILQPCAAAREKTAAEEEKGRGQLGIDWSVCSAVIVEQEAERKRTKRSACSKQPGREALARRDNKSEEKEETEVPEVPEEGEHQKSRERPLRSAAAAPEGREAIASGATAVGGPTGATAVGGPTGAAAVGGPTGAAAVGGPTGAAAAAVGGPSSRCARGRRRAAPPPPPAPSSSSSSPSSSTPPRGVPTTTTSSSSGLCKALPRDTPREHRESPKAGGGSVLRDETLARNALGALGIMLLIGAATYFIV